MNSLLETRRLEHLAGWLWGLVLLTLPVTTFPLIPGPLGRTVVKPLAFYPLALLLPVLALLFLRGKRWRLPANHTPLLAFLLVALAASFIAALYAPIELRGAGYLERVTRGWISLLIGLLFFGAAFWMNRDEEDLKRSLKWLFAGLALTLAWSLVQAVAVNTDLLARSAIDQIQLFFSERGVQPRRITGFAYEPAWLADQMVIFYMPWLVAAIFAGRSIANRGWLAPTLLAFCAAVLLLTYSRSGLANGILTLLVVTALLGRGTLVGLWRWFWGPLGAECARTGAGLALRAGILLLLALALVGTLSFWSQYDYFANLWRASLGQTLVNYLSEINVAQRVAYAEAGYRVFEDHPLSGVGLGASGLYLLPKLPEWSLSLPEVARQLASDSQLIPNTKSLYTRLLAETGLPGFWFFAVFMLSFLSAIRRQWLSGDATLRYVATAGLFAWVGLTMRNLTQDSLTFPIMWVSLGMIIGFAPTAWPVGAGKES